MASGSVDSSANGARHSGVPFLDLQRQLVPLKQEVLAALAEVWDSGAFALGPEVGRLEQRVADYCGTKHAIGCASGSDALLLALTALGVEPGDEVIVPSFTFFATASAVTRLGAKPVFADIDPVTFNMAPEAIESLVTEATKAIIPVHLFGQCADMKAICASASQRGIPVVEDAAQAIGAECAGRSAGAIGNVGCFSFYPTKNLGGAGDGGMLTTDDDQLAQKLRLLRVHGMEPRYFHSVVGINSRLDAFQAAVLNVKLSRLERWIEMRQTLAIRYTQLMAEAGLDRRLVLPVAVADRRHVWNQYVIRVPDGQRDPLRQYLTACKIGTEIYYPLGLHEQPCFAYLGYQPHDLPETYRASREVLALPLFPELLPAEQEVVVEQIARFFGARRQASGPPRPKLLEKRDRSPVSVPGEGAQQTLRSRRDAA